jgi:TSS9, PorZ, N-terminal beta-propeller domain/Two component regulator propeller
MRRISIIQIFLLLYLYSTGQTPVGSWSDHLVYNTANCLSIGIKHVYASTGSSIIAYNKEFAELKKMSRITGLTETGISTISFSKENNALIVGYKSTNIDLLIDNTIYNLPDISRKYIPGKKEINRILTQDKYAYLACSFGIVVIDISKKEIYDTWKPGTGTDNTEVWDIAFGNGKIYAATGKGVYSAELTNQGLAYFGNWNQITSLPVPDGKYTSVIFAGTKLYVNWYNPFGAEDAVYAIDEISTLLPDLSGVKNRSFDPAPDGFTVSSSNSVKYCDINGSVQSTISTYGWSTPNISQAIIENGDIWIADINSGLIQGKNMTAFLALALPGPISNNAYSITSYNGKTVISGGGGDVSWNNQWRPLEISRHENNQWSNLTSATIKDAMRALIDPNNSNHMFVSTWGGGLLEYENDILIKQYTELNSPLQTIIPGRPYVRICGLAMDKSNNLWITQSGVPNTIKVLKPDGSWILNPITIDLYTVGDIIITKTGHKWIILPRGYGLFVLDDNNTPENFSDDKSKKLIIKDSENKIISNVYSIAEDLDGNIWVGTDQGPLIYYNPEKVFDDDLPAYKIKIPRNDGTDLADYMLGTELITSIAVDGANRKWLGTYSSGAYLLSSDGTTLMKNYNELNSPILSNSIVSLAVDNLSGDIWLGTSKGIQSVRGDATVGEEIFSNVYTFPNPVREDFSGNVTITGLIRDTQIRITDISGNLVYNTVSDGGQATWDLKTYNGKRVTTGVYLVFCASNDGTQSTVTKMLVIR